MVSLASKQTVWLGVGLLLVIALPVWGQAVGTPILEPPLKLAWPAGMPALTGPLMPSVADWNGDGRPEVLCSDGAGALWLLLVKVTATEARVTEATPVVAVGEPVRTSHPAKPNLVDFNGDGREDLVIEDVASRTLRVYRNVGTKQKPQLAAFQCARSGGVPVLGVEGGGADGLLRLPELAQGRVTVADWDRDGRPDLIFGEWGGALMVLRGEGTATSPLFPSAPVPASYDGHPIIEAYTPYPTVADLNADGAPDLAYGVNWGYVVFYVSSAPSGAPVLTRRVGACVGNAADWNQRAATGDYVWPDFGDLDADGKLDAVFGGRNPDLFVSRGSQRGSEQILRHLDELLAGGAEAASARLAGDPALRQTLLDEHALLHQFALWGTGPGNARAELFERLLGHCRRYSFLYGDHPIPVSEYPGLPWVVFQQRATLRELADGSPARLRQVAEALGLSPGRAQVLCDTGVLLQDNSKLQGPQVAYMHAMLTAIPAALHNLYCITTDDLGPRLERPRQAGQSVNMYGGGDILGVITNEFGTEVDWRSPDWCACAAHEVNHAVDAHYFTWNRALYARKIRLLDDAAPDEVVFAYRPYSEGLDWEATKAAFRNKGLWDGVDANWQAAWERYWKEGAGAAARPNYLRDCLDLLVGSPQEAFATLANQYFASSDVMYQLALVRWQKGYRHPINQFLFFVDVYSQGTNTSRVYQTDAKGNFQWHEAKLSRDAAGHINGMQIGGAWHDFTLDAQGLVTAIR